MIDLIFISCNRLEYTKLALPSLLADPTEEFTLTIWDNCSKDGTQEYLSSVEDPRITRRIYAKENVGLRGAVNDLFVKSSADLVGIIPNDIQFVPGWTRPLAKAHADIPELGMVGCWHLGREFFDESRALNKIQKFGCHQILRHPWTGGGAGLVKLKTVRDCGLLESNGTTSYWKRMALKGYVNGYYFPPIYVEHMDYPWSEHFAFSGKFDQWAKTCRWVQCHNFRTVEDAKAWHRIVVQNILDDPWEAKYYIGWRRKLRAIKGRMSNFIWRVKNWRSSL